MGEYANIKSKKFYQLLDWLTNHKRFEILQGTKHSVKAHAIETNQIYPLPLNHKVINKFIIKGFCNWLIANNVCTKEDFDLHI